MPFISSAHTILVHAQQAVDRWSTGPMQPNFALAMETATWLYWSPSHENERERDAFCQVAAAIHRGEGHLLTSPVPLLRIAHAVLDA
jgi:hypothetical protein